MMAEGQEDRSGGQHEGGGVAECSRQLQTPEYAEPASLCRDTGSHLLHPSLPPVSKSEPARDPGRRAAGGLVERVGIWKPGMSGPFQQHLLWAAALKQAKGRKEFCGQICWETWG